MTKILLVEDDKSLREIYGVRLLAEGYDIISAGDGEEALAMAIKDRPALIVSDVMMPKISGFDMLDILRSTTETKDIKVIMMTALSSEDQRQRGVSLGADRYLVKSQVGIEDVVRTVHEVLGDAPTSSSNTPPSSIPPRPAPTSPDTPAASFTASAASSGLPQPTAPFSTPRPANLGDRVINPLRQEDYAPKDFSNLMNEELASIGASPVAPMPTGNQPAPPIAPPASQPQTTTSQPIQPGTSDPTLSFEETALPSSQSATIPPQAQQPTQAPQPIQVQQQPAQPVQPQQTDAVSPQPQAYQQPSQHQA